jgi:hypothetical protein
MPSNLKVGALIRKSLAIFWLDCSSGGVALHPEIIIREENINIRLIAMIVFLFIFYFFTPRVYLYHRKVTGF